MYSCFFLQRIQSFSKIFFEKKLSLRTNFSDGLRRAFFEQFIQHQI